MSGILAGLISPGLTQVAKSRTAYLSGQRQAEQEGIAASLAALKAKREAESAAILDALHKAQTEKALRLPSPKAPTKVKVVQPDNSVVFVDPDAPPPDLKERGPAEPAPTFRTGSVTGTGQTPGVRASSAKPTAEQEKSYLFFNLMDKALPRIEAATASGKVRKPAITAFMATPGLAADFANVGLNAEEQSYIRSLRDFAAGVLRKESGAAVTHAELRDVFRRYATGFGDVPEMDAEKAAAAREYMESMRALASPALDYYKARGSAGGGAGSATRTPSRGLSALRAAAEAQLRAQGKTDEQILAELGPPDGDE